MSWCGKPSLLDETAGGIFTVNMVNKIVTLDQMCRLSREYTTLGRTIVFTNGCFDILHTGHVAYLEEAKARGWQTRQRFILSTFGPMIFLRISEGSSYS